MYRGYFEIGIFHCKTYENVGTLWRSAYQLGAAGIFTIGRRFKKQASDTVKAYRHIPYREYNTLEEFLSNRPHDCVLIGIEQDGTPLRHVVHPERAIYLLGAEDHGLTKEAISKCQHTIELDSVQMNSYNVAVAGSIVMYHRQFL